MSNLSLRPLPLPLLSCTFTDGELVPAWLTARDRPWLRDLLFEAEAHVGRPATELVRRWRRSDPDPRAGGGLAAARHVLLQLLTPRGHDRAASLVRRELFAVAAAGADREHALATVAALHARPVAALTSGLFADLPHARRLVMPTPAVSVSQLLLATNRAMAEALVATAERAELLLLGAARAVLRTTWLHGTRLVEADADGQHVRLQWRREPRDPRGGRRLAALLGALPWARHFTLRAQCRGPAHTGTFVLASGDEILPGPEPRAFDSQLERNFAHAFATEAPDWELVHEPAPLRCGDQLAFPDFLVRRRGVAHGFWLEIAGLRDPAALPGKLALLAHEPRYLLCLPRAHVPAERLGHPRLVPFTRRVAVADVLPRLRELFATSGP